MKKITYSGETGAIRMGDVPLEQGKSYEVDDDTAEFLEANALSTPVQASAKDRKPTPKVKE